MEHSQSFILKTLSPRVSALSIPMEWIQRGPKSSFGQADKDNCGVKKRKRWKEPDTPQIAVQHGSILESLPRYPPREKPATTLS